MLKKIGKKLIVAMLTMAMAVTALTGCRAEKAEVKENVVRINVYDAGYGIAHLNAIITKFEEAYADEGYKIVINKADKTFQGTTPLTEMSVGFENNRVDMYYTGNLTTEFIIERAMTMSGEVVKTADLTDVFESAPIELDGSEGEGTIRDKMVEGCWENLQVDLTEAKKVNSEYAQYEGKNYVVPFISNPSGFVVNTERMEAAGLEVPKTTNELLACIDSINAKREAGQDGFSNTYPVSWSGGEAYNYWRSLYDVWYAQCEGVESFNDFYTLDSYIGNLSESYKVYETEGWKQVYDLMAVLLNDENAPADTLSMNARSAQDRVLTGKSVFSPCGAWLKSEMGTEYLEDMEHCILIKTPVLSQVGVNLKLDGKDGKDTVLCDKVLSMVVGMIDEGKASADIIAEVSASYGVTLNEDQVAGVKSARGIYCEPWKQGWVVAEDSPSVDICKLFLRFLANDYSTEVMQKLSSAVSVYSKDYEYKETGDVFNDSVIEWMNTEERYAIERDTSATTVRGLANFDVFENLEWELNFGRAISNKTITAEEYYKEQVEYAKKVSAKLKG